VPDLWNKLWKKLNLKNPPEIVVLNAPPSFEPALASLADVRVVRDLSTAPKLTFLLAFVTRQEEIPRLAGELGTKAEGDAVVWLAYPKKSSKRYRCDFSRDTGWEPLGERGFEAVRQVAIDDDFSALRFRRVEYIGNMKRDPERALSAEGRRKASKGP
jgi:hypothetical protein